METLKGYVKIDGRIVRVYSKAMQTYLRFKKTEEQALGHITGSPIYDGA